MKIYFAGSILGGRKLQPVYTEVVNHLIKSGHDVLTDHVASKTVLFDEAQSSMRDIFKRDLKWLDICDLFIAEVTKPSLGVGYEIAYAIFSKKPILCLCKKGTCLSAMISGNTYDDIQIEYYNNIKCLIGKMEMWIHKVV